ncbi:DNA double-strand break repair protein Rad50 [Candidatus Phytoplasma rubi]|uniref:DNA double-strand break repair protein Rad50 n=1 Tax=Candidatus Phytoplasma rubi TaxID=399025 RepID=A0ABY7BSR8_9MOLU|nr:DNA double-strand break repair protein Rad50 [Candidatus Phytoplasma rubi]WAN63035.1 DNA double-strand break repair protein Rad50 [Candidatus Phytoplasma rubi]
MLSTLDLFKSYFTFQSYFTWFLLASILFGGFLFFKIKNYRTHTTTWKGYLIYFLIIIGCLSFIYLCFFHQPKESSSKYLGQLINEIDKAIDKYDKTINNYKGLKSDWEGELRKCEEELKTLYEQQVINQEQKEKIKKLLDQTELKITDIKTQQQETEKNINILKEQQKQKEQEKAEKEKEIAKKQEEEKLASSDDKIRLKTEIGQLQDEVIELVGQISYIKRDIGNLEADQRMYENMLSNAIILRDSLQRDYVQLTSDEKKLFAKIKSVEERKAEIQKNIDEINQKINEIKIEQVLYKSFKEKYKAMHVRMMTYEKENEFSFGNAFKFGFKTFDKVADLIPAKFGIKTLGKTVSVTRKYAQTMGKVTLTLHEGHRLWHMYNEVTNETKETTPMITKEALEMYSKDIDRDLAKLDADKKDCEKKIEEYKNRRDNNVLLSTETLEEEIQEEQRKNRKISVIDEYEKIINELHKKKNEIKDISKLEEKHDKLEEEIYTKKEEINIKKEELKQKSPNYARAQQKLQQKRQTKIPEMIMIPNK